MVKRYVAVHLSLLLPALAGAGCAADPPPDGVIEPEASLIGEGSDALTTRLRLMAANITSGTAQSYDPGHGRRIMQGVKPDIALLQEFNYGNNSADDLREFVNVTFGTGFSYYREAGAQIPNGIVSRWPIVASGEWDDGSVGNRDFAWARIDIPGPVDLWAVSVHLLTSDAGVRNTEAQSLVRSINAHVPPGDYLVIGGDFNTDSRTEACITTFRQVVVASAPYPADKNGDADTNASRGKPYDWVLVDGDLEPHETAVVIGGSTFTNGLVVDTRVYSPISEISPALSSDSGASGMQHMAVVRDFMIPDGGGGTGTPDGGGGTGVASVIINEVLVNEPGSDTDGEFVEIVNVGSATAALGGWTLSDSTTRHTFASSVSLAPSTAITVFGGAGAIPSGVSGAIAASSGALGLANGGDTITLRNTSGATVDSLTYPSSPSGSDGISLNRSPDATAGAGFVQHTTFNTSAPLSSSPGRRASGLPF
ncbi:uncharacterized protein SOCE26_080970 [Sorangium cellulosum]|uniref:LTD domain-containing protein n=2 Tax=Sorangium cellulosum TaxID=56 RepID=A0A2L0F518_SORCE|nr:uncharacterized protein SOCE26_080970 [Sorangium cellulosum]